MAKTLTVEDVRNLLKTEVDRHGSQTAVARRFGCSPAYISDVLAGRREPGGLILDALGLTSVFGYTRKAR